MFYISSTLVQGLYVDFAVSTMIFLQVIMAFVILRFCFDFGVFAIDC